MTHSAVTDIPELLALLFVCALEQCLEHSRSPNGYPNDRIYSMAGGEFEQWLVTGMRTVRNVPAAMLRLSSLISWRMLLGSQSMAESPQGSLFNFATLIETGTGSYQLGTYRRMAFSLLNVFNKVRQPCCLFFVHPILWVAPTWSCWWWLDEEYWVGRIFHGYSHEDVWECCRFSREVTLHEVALTR
jgi:hypothetical protein